MSQVVSTPQQICNSPLNLSKSKMLYTFPKAERQSMAEKSAGAHVFYDLPPVKETRAAGFGYGNKYDFTQGSAKTPAPNAYALVSPTNDPAKKKGFSFGLSREVMAATGSFVGYRGSPGPAAYDTRETNKTSIAFSIRSRTKSTENQNTSLTVPGPGAYPTFETISPKGKLFVSKYQSASTTVFSPAIQKRFDVGKAGEKPGPGAYPVVGEINPKGAYYLSKFRSSIGKTFGLALKQKGSTEAFKDKCPGPGAYRLPSDFGYYEAKSPSKTASD